MKHKEPIVKAKRAKATYHRKTSFSRVDRCEVCGWAPPQLIRQRIRLLHLHHIVPIAQGGADARDNLVVVCPTCHAIAHATWWQGCGNYPLTRLVFVATLRKRFDNPNWNGYGTPTYLPRRNIIDGEKIERSSGELSGEQFFTEVTC